jgi:hypothetical protein
MKLTFTLAHATARARALDAIAQAPDGFVVEVREPTRSRDQNDKLHALLSDVGQKLGWRWCGFSVDIDDLKSIFVAAYRKTNAQQARILPGLEGEPVLLGWRTRDMPKREMSELIEMIEAWQANR